MPYIQRDNSGLITGTYIWPQPGYAEEFLANDDPALTAYYASLISLATVQAECQRRIDLVVTDNQKLNMLGSMVANQIAGNHADDANFLASMQWIAAMRGAISGLVGNVAYNQDASWPPLSDDLKAFGARF